MFLVAFLILAPLHLAYGLIFHDVIALRELHPAIAEFPPQRQVRGVGRASLDQARIWFWILVAVDVALIPLVARVSRRVLAADAAGDVPTALGAWRSIGNGGHDIGVRGGSVLGTILAGAALALVVAGLTEAGLLLVADLLPDSIAFGGVALAQAIGRSAGIPFFVIPLLYALGSRSTVPAETVPDVY